MNNGRNTERVRGETQGNREESQARWVPAETLCFSDFDNECQELEYFTQEPMESEEFKGKLIKLRFSLPATASKRAVQSGERGIQRVTECYNIDSLFRYVFQQIFENQPEIVTPTKKALSSAQIARIRRCYFGQDQSERQWENIDEFYSEMELRAQERDMQERQALLELYSQATESEDGVDFEDREDREDREAGVGGLEVDGIPAFIYADNFEEGTQWLIEQFPVLENEVPEFLPDMYISMMQFLVANGLLRLDRYTFNEIIENPDNARDIIQHLVDEYADLEDYVPSEGGEGNEGEGNEGARG